MTIDRTKALKEWRIHQTNSWVFVGLLFLVVFAFMGVSLRLLKPQLLVSGALTFLIVQTVLFLNSGKLVVRIMRCKKLEGEILARVVPIVERLARQAGLARVPVLFTAKMDTPNAFAFYGGVADGHGIAVTDELLTLLDDAELQAVLAHELGHIRSRDTAFMTLVSITLTAVNKLIYQGIHIGRLSLIWGILLEIAVYLPRVVVAGISQLREYAADAFSASMTGETDALISAFNKLGAWKKDQATTNNPLDRFRRVTMDELMLSHPNMHQRIWMLGTLNKES